MSVRSFRSLFMVASCAGAALGCYLVSLRVASERASLEQVETRIVLAQRDLRVLQTEIGTRGRLSQLERWNAGAFALSAPAADQFLQGSFELARLAQPDHKVDFHAPVVLAAAPAPDRSKLAVGQPDTDESGQPAVPALTPNALLHEASLKTETREVPARTVAILPPAPAPKSTDKPATAARPAASKSVDKPGLAAAQSVPKKPAPKPALTAAKPAAKKSVDKAAVAFGQPVTKPVRLAKNDPLAPLPVKHSAPGRAKASKDSTADR
jgi:hypothetical protein